MMRAASKGMPVKDFPAPSAKIRNGDLKPLPGVIGASVSKAQQRLRDAGFESFVAGQVASSLPAGTVAYTNPAGSAFPGSKIGLYVSTGVPAYQPPDPQTQTQPQPQPTPTAQGKPGPRGTPPPKKK